MTSMSIREVPWWRWRAEVRWALHVLGDADYQRTAWWDDRTEPAGVVDAVYGLVGDTWLDHWSSSRYVPAMLRDAEEAWLVDQAVTALLTVFHSVGPDAPNSAYLRHPHWSEVVATAAAAHTRLAEADGDDPAVPPRPRRPAAPALPVA